jgi:hypothetical protein
VNSPARKGELRLREGSVAWRQLDDEVLLLDLRTNTYLGTNASATRLWRLLEAGTTRQELIDDLVTEYEIGAEIAAGDIDAFLADCRQRDLLDPEND